MAGGKIDNAAGRNGRGFFGFGVAPHPRFFLDATKNAEIVNLNFVVGGNGVRQSIKKNGGKPARLGKRADMRLQFMRDVFARQVAAHCRNAIPAAASASTTAETVRRMSVSVKFASAPCIVNLTP